MDFNIIISSELSMILDMQEFVGKLPSKLKLRFYVKLTQYNEATNKRCIFCWRRPIRQNRSILSGILQLQSSFFFSPFLFFAYLQFSRLRFSCEIASNQLNQNAHHMQEPGAYDFILRKFLKSRKIKTRNSLHIQGFRFQQFLQSYFIIFPGK